MSLYGGKKFVIPLDGDYGGLSDEEPEDFDEDEAVVVQFWVSPYEDEHAIEVESGSMSTGFPLFVAEKVAKAIGILTRWPSTKAGKKEIARLRKSHWEWEERLQKDREERRATQTGGKADGSR